MGQIAYGIAGAAQAASVSEHDVIDAIGARKLDARNLNGQPLIPHSALAVWVESLPSWYPTS